jgi:hypothetical protein
MGCEGKVKNSMTLRLLADAVFYSNYWQSGIRPRARKKMLSYGVTRCVLFLASIEALLSNYR